MRRIVRVAPLDSLAGHAGSRSRSPCEVFGLCGCDPGMEVEVAPPLIGLFCGRFLRDPVAVLPVLPDHGFRKKRQIRW